MKRLNIVDAAFVYSETKAPQHTLKIAVLAPDDYRFEDMKALCAERLDRLPPLHWMPVRTPLGLHRPVWNTSVPVDFDRHIRRIGCPAPGGERELCEVISELSGRPIDQSRPMWELWLIEGLEGGRVAALLKLHHSLSDGLASKHLLELLFTTEPDGELAPVPDHDVDPLPSRPKLAWLGARDYVRDVRRRLPEIRAQRAHGRAEKERIGEENLPPKQYSSRVKTPFNGVLHRERHFAVTSAELAEVKAAGKAFDATINDVFMSAIGGALRRHLDDRGELPDEPLIASVPIATRPPEDRSFGNQLSTMLVSLRIDVDDTLERLEAQKIANQQAKAEFAATRGSRMEDWFELLPPGATRAVVALAVPGLKLGSPPAQHVILSNVPGPQQQLWLGSTPVDAFYSTGQVFHGLGLNITTWSYVDRLNTCVFAGRDTMDDPWELIARIDDEFARIVKAAAQRD